MIYCFDCFKLKAILTISGSLMTLFFFLSKNTSDSSQPSVEQQLEVMTNLMFRVCWCLCDCCQQWPIGNSVVLSLCRRMRPGKG